MKTPESNVISNPDKDLEIQVEDLRTEFRNFPSTRYAYAEQKAAAEYEYDLAKQTVKELRAQKYVELKSSGQKITEANVEALLDIDPEVKKAVQKMFDASRDLNTITEYTKSLDAKKDMLIQLGADARKEL